MAHLAWWHRIGLLFLIVIMGLVGAVLIPAEKRAADATRMQTLGGLATVIVFLMVTKPGAHS